MAVFILKGYQMVILMSIPLFIKVILKIQVTKGVIINPVAAGFSLRRNRNSKNKCSASYMKPRNLKVAATPFHNFSEHSPIQCPVLDRF
jgi:hypothetical protein